MPLETPEFAAWSVADVAEYLSAHLTEHHPELLDEVTANVEEEQFDGKALAAAVASDAKWKQAMHRLIPTYAEGPIEKWLACIPVKLALAADLKFSAAAAARRDQRFDASFAEGDLWCLDKQGSPYYPPAGWVRYAIQPSNPSEEIFKAWPVAYHGTDADNVDGIITNGLLPEINSQHGTDPVICLSPSIRYSSNWVFYEPKLLGPDRWLQTVFEVRVRPGAYQVQRNTLRWDGGWEDQQVLFDPLYAQDELEWLVENPEDVVVTGLLVKVLTQNPEEALREYFQKRHKLQSHPRLGAGNVQWQWNCAPEKTLSSAGPWEVFAPALSERIERAYQAHRDAFYVGHIGHGDHTYFIEFRKMEMHSANGETDGKKHFNWERRAIQRKVL